MFTFTFQAEDYFAKYTGLQDNQTLLPKITIDPADFADAPTDVRGKAIPIVYGDRSRIFSATAAPTWVPDASRSLSLNGNTSGVVGSAGYGDLVGSTATPPTTVTPVASAGGSLNLSDVPGSTYYFMVTAFDAGGLETNPFPFLPASAATVTISANAQKITVSWSGATGATKYRCYLGASYFGIRWQQYIETAGTSCVFDKQPPFPGTQTTPSNISTGASNVLYSDIDYYAVSALMADGETTLSGELQWVGTPFGPDHRRPSYLSWTAVAGALGYRIYKRPPTGTYLWRFDVAAGTTTFQDDMTNLLAAAITGAPKQDGPFPLTYVGTVKDVFGVTFRRFVGAQHACQEVTTIFQGGVAVHPGNYGVSFYAPGKPGYASRFGAPYTDINGKRFMCVHVLGPQGDAAADGSQPLRWAGKGIETNADTTGTLLTDLLDQYVHFFRNYVLRDGTGTSWATTGPTWGDSPVDVDIIDAATFTDVKARWALRVTGGCTGAFAIGVNESGELTQESVNTWIARLNLSADVRSYFSRKSQFSVTMFWRTTTELAAAPSYTASLGINRGTFKITDRPEKVENAITIRYALQPAATEPWSSLTTQDVDSQNALGEVKPRTIDLWCITNAAVAWAIGDSRLKRRRFPVREAEWESDMGALTDDLGTLVGVTHPDGYGAAGWVQQPCIFTRHEFDPQQLKVRVTAEDSYWIFDAAVSGTQPVPSAVGDSEPGAGVGIGGQSDVMREFDLLMMAASAQGAYFVHDPGDDWIAQPDLDPAYPMPFDNLHDESVED